MGLIPAYRVEANGQDITQTIRERFVSLTLKDSVGTDSDSLELVLDDSRLAQPIKLPPTGAELEVWLGYGEPVRRMGLFVCNAVKISGWPGQMTITANAAPWDGTPKGKSDLQSQKTRSWPMDVTIGEMVRQMAAEHGLEPAISPSLEDVKPSAGSQCKESDMNMLLRLAKRYDAVAKPAGGRLIFAKRGESKSVTGIELPRVVLAPADVGQWDMSINTKKSAGTAIANYRDAAKAEQHRVTVGSGEPVVQLPGQFCDADSARFAARAKQVEQARAEVTFNVTDMPGRPDLTAEALLILEGWRNDMGGEWLVTEVTHKLDAQGYRCAVKAERPNNDDAVMAAIDAETRDEIVKPNVVLVTQGLRGP